MAFPQLKRVEALTSALEILSGFDEENAKECVKIGNIVTELVSGIDKAKAVLQESKNAIVRIKQLSQEYDFYNEYLHYVDDNLPEDVPDYLLSQLHIKDKSVQEIQSTINTKAVTQESSEVLRVPRGLIAEPMRAIDEAPTGTLRHISVQELNSVHKYMRGRLTVEEVNSFVDLFNSVLMKKYDILKQPKNKVKPYEQLLYTKWKRMMKDAALSPGTFFCTTADFVTLENHKMAKSSFTKLVVLRHLKLIKETRCGSETLYII